MKVVTVKLTNNQYNNMTSLDLAYLNAKIGRTIRRPDNLKLPKFVNGGK